MPTEITSKKVMRHYTPCGKGHWKKADALSHAESCKCWTNPKHKTCKTCISCGGCDGEFGYICENDNAKDDHNFGEGKGADFNYISVNCHLWAGL